MRTISEIEKEMHATDAEIKRLQVKLDTLIWMLEHDIEFKKEKRKYTKRKIYGQKNTTERRTIGTTKQRRAKQAKYSDEVVSYIKDNASHMSNIDLINSINKKFDISITYSKLNALMTYRKINRKHRDYKLKKESKNEYSEEIIEYIKENIDVIPTGKLLKELNIKYNLKMNLGKFYPLIRKLGIKKEKSGTTHNSPERDILMVKSNSEAFSDDEPEEDRTEPEDDD